MNTNRIITADCTDYLKELPENALHAAVTDPPYGLAFMGRDWDDFEPKEYQEWCQEWAEAVKRVLKPGGHLLAFSGNRTHHRLFTGVEDAGFEIRDTLTWHYGSGFPKAADIGKTIDKREGAEREVVGEKVSPDGKPYSDRKKKFQTEGSHDEYKRPSDEDNPRTKITEPATQEAQKWDGWKTGLKPATEYVVMARKPFEGATVDCVQEHGTGALNIDGTRIHTDEEIQEVERGGFENSYEASKTDWGEGDVYTPNEQGRYPSNVVFDETEAERLDEQVGTLSSGDPVDGTIQDKDDRDQYGDYGGEYDHTGFGDSGGPSRYFYTSKASKSERTENGSIDNSHPTVKPVDLMEWLIKLITREGQIVLDPFCGSGTTCKAAKTLNREFIGIEKQDKWADVARVRCNLTPDDPSVVRDNDNQEGLESFLE